MKTKFILHGGYTRERNEQNEEFFKELASSIPNKGTILLVYFASDGEFAQKFEEDKARISNYITNKKVNFVLANEEEFISQVKNANLIYLRGGDTEKLKNQLNSYPEFAECILGKVIAGSSAGAYVISKFYYSNSKNKVFEGFGFLPIRIACHYQSKIHPIQANTDPISDLNKFDSSLELILLKDYEWKVLD